MWNPCNISPLFSPDRKTQLQSLLTLNHYITHLIEGVPRGLLGHTHAVLGLAKSLLVGPSIVNDNIFNHSCFPNKREKSGYCIILKKSGLLTTTTSPTHGLLGSLFPPTLFLLPVGLFLPLLTRNKKKKHKTYTHLHSNKCKCHT